MDTIPAWLDGAVFYQIFPDRFARSGRVPKPPHLESWGSPPTVYGFKGGDLEGIIEHLDYLSDLGITALYLNPVFQSAANHRYHTYDYFHVDPLLGGDEALRRLLDAAHARDIRIILDGVFNHTGRGFYQFHHTLENGSASPYLDWFYFDEERLRAGRPIVAYPDHPVQDSLAELGYRAWWDLPALPKLNTETPAVRRFIFSVTRHWLEFGIDGWRLDVPYEIDDDEFWREFRQVVKEVNPEAYIVGEIWGDGSRWLQGDMFDAVMNYPFSRACLGFCGGERLDISYRPGGYELRSLDAPRFASEVENLLGRHSWEVTQAQFNLLGSHDTPRFLTLVGGDVTAFKLAVLVQMTFPGVPCIYYGDEVGLEGGPDPGCRRSFPWDEEVWDVDLLAYVRRCIALRKAHPALRSGEYVTLLAAGQVYAFLRRSRKEALVVVLNGGSEGYRLEIPVGERLREGACLRGLLGGGEARVVAGRLVGAEVPGRTGDLFLLPTEAL